MNIYKQEFKMIRGSVLTWSLSIAALLVIMMSFFSTMAADAEMLKLVMDQMPEELLIAFGMTGLDMSQVLGFFGFLFLFVQLCLAIQASNYGFGLLSLEERDVLLRGVGLFRPGLAIEQIVEHLPGESGVDDPGNVLHR